MKRAHVICLLIIALVVTSGCVKPREKGSRINRDRGVEKPVKTTITTTTIKTPTTTMIKPSNVTTTTSHSIPPKTIPSSDPCNIKPTYSNVEYGVHNDDLRDYDPTKDRNVLDLWTSKSKKPTPLLVFIHGGGFQYGSKEDIREQCYNREGTSLIKLFLDSGFSVASINYRLMNDENSDWRYTPRWYAKEKTPAPMLDAAKAIGYLKKHAKEYNINKNRVSVMGTSAGGCISFWLGFHDDIMVDGFSTKPECIGPWKGQSTFDPHVLSEIHPGMARHKNILAFYGIERRDVESALSDERYDILFKEASPATHISPDDVPVFMYYNQPLYGSDGMIRGAHNPVFGVYAEEFLKNASITYELHYPSHEGLSPYEAALKTKDFFLKNC